MAVILSTDYLRLLLRFVLLNSLTRIRHLCDHLPHSNCDGATYCLQKTNWWPRRTTSERCFTIVSAFICVAIIGLAEGNVIHIKRTEMKTPQSSPLNLNDSDHCNTNGVCLTSECVHTASTVLSKMNTKVDPCENFHQFSCGNFIDETQIPEDEFGMNTMTLTEEKLQEQLKAIITQERPETDLRHFKLPNLVYKACMNTSLIEDLGTQPIVNISDSLGGWPVIYGHTWDNNGTWSWQETIKKLRWLGFGTEYLLNFRVHVDMKNNTKRIIGLDQPVTGLQREYLVKGLNERFVAAYYDYMVDIAVLMGAEQKAAEEESMEVLQFEMDLANITLPEEKSRNHSDFYNLRTIKQLQKSYQYMNWSDYINAILPKDVQVNENEVINLWVPSFLDDFGKLLQRTKKRVIANYLMGRIYLKSVSYLTEKLRERQLKYFSALLGIQERQPRWKECIAAASRFPIALGSMYVRKHFERDSKDIALEMVNNIRAAFSQILDKVGWMDYKTKQEAKKKLNGMDSHIGYPDEILDDDKLEEYHRSYEIDPEKYFESRMNIVATSTTKMFNKLRIPVNKTDWTTHGFPAVINAYYEPKENTIMLPAGILQGHFFNAKRPNYMNYGAVGSVIGHEVTHAFDDEGKQYDVNGNLTNWWEAATQQAFLEKTQCIIDQYGNYTDKQTGLKLNGIKTQGENIADNGGIKEAYLAYNHWVAKNGAERKLPGLQYTPKQMFWISAAQTWCSKFRTEFVKILITTGVHSTDEFRVLGPMTNSIEFSLDFECNVGTHMNPVHKCVVW